MKDPGTKGGHMIRATLKCRKPDENVVFLLLSGIPSAKSVPRINQIAKEMVRKPRSANTWFLGGQQQSSLVRKVRYSRPKSRVPRIFEESFRVIIPHEKSWHKLKLNHLAEE